MPEKVSFVADIYVYCEKCGELINVSRSWAEKGTVNLCVLPHECAHADNLANDGEQV